jgi:hypothetical protein
MNTNTTKHDHTEKNIVIDEMFEQAARNQGFESLAELVEVSSWLSNETDPASYASDMNDQDSAPMMPKLEFKDQFDAWLKAKKLKACQSV